MTPQDSLQDQIVSQWKLLVVLMMAGLVGSISINVFFFRLDRELNNQLRSQQNQITQIERSRLGLQAIVQDLQSFSVKYPDIAPILSKHGIGKPSAPQSAPVPPPPPPAPPTKKK